MIQALSRRPVNAEARLRHQANRCGICGRQSCTETGIFFSRYFGFPLSVSEPALHIHSPICHRRWETL